MTSTEARQLIKEIKQLRHFGTDVEYLGFKDAIERVVELIKNK